MRNWIDLLALVAIALVVGFIVNAQENEITKLRGDIEVLVIENNTLKFQLQKQCNTDIETVITLEIVVAELKG